jgi:hypothetical protein
VQVHPEHQLAELEKAEDHQAHIAETLQLQVDHQLAELEHQDQEHVSLIIQEE